MISGSARSLARFVGFRAELVVMASGRAEEALAAREIAISVRSLQLERPWAHQIDDHDGDALLVLG